jgi:hypothetical protein
MTDGGIVEGSNDLTTEARAWSMEHDQQIQRSSVDPLELILSGDLSWPWPLARCLPPTGLLPPPDTSAPRFLVPTRSRS